MKNNLVTIVTVTYNAEKHIEETIMSVINQSYEYLQYIIIDGGSTDRTIEIIKKYDDKIDYWISEPDNGIYFAMNKAIKEAAGIWVNFMNAGDSFVSNDIVSSVMKEDIDKYDLIYGGIFVINGNNKYIVASPEGKDLLSYPAICHQSLFTRSKILKKYLFDTTYKICADYDFELKCESDGYKFKRLNYPIANFMTGGLNSSELYRTRIEGIFILLKHKDITVAKNSQMSQRFISDGLEEKQ